MHESATRASPRFSTPLLLAGIRNGALSRQLSENGYTTTSIDDISELADLDQPFDLMIVSEEQIREAEAGLAEKLYFLNGSTTVAVLLHDPLSIDENLLRLLRFGSFEALYEHEILTGLIISRIDSILITTRLDHKLLTLQHDSVLKNRLERELTIREQTLLHERRMNANLLASITSGIVIIDTEGIILVVNQQARELLPEPETATIGASCSRALPASIMEVIDAVRTRSEASPPPYVMAKHKIEERHLEITGYRMRDYDGRKIGILLLLQDITEQESTTVQLYRAEKLATVGTMLSGIAHELRNPLSIISARAQRALHRPTTDQDKLEKVFSSIELQAERCATIINGILDFTRNTATRSGSHGIAAILEETLTYIDYQNIFDNIEIVKRFQPDLHVWGDRSRYVQVFLNLIANAADAMEGRGTLTLVTKTAANNLIEVEVRDTGPGIPEEIESKIFDPFFTTRETGCGTGLGLSIVYKIIQDSGGKIRLRSGDNGTSFFVSLPAIEGRTTG
jgi:PAS domain S-box-containing protein